MTVNVQKKRRRYYIKRQSAHRPVQIQLKPQNERPTAPSGRSGTAVLSPLAAVSAGIGIAAGAFSYSENCAERLGAILGDIYSPLPSERMLNLFAAMVIYAVILYICGAAPFCRVGLYVIPFFRGMGDGLQAAYAIASGAGILSCGKSLISAVLSTVSVVLIASLAKKSAQAGKFLSGFLLSVLVCAITALILWCGSF